jgi:hypothetical protein
MYTRAMSGYAAANPHVNNVGSMQRNLSQHPISTVYANASEVLLGEDRNQIISSSVQSHQQDPWVIIQKMSEDNRILLEQVSRFHC